MRRLLITGLALALPLATWALPTDLLPIADLSVIEHRVLAVFVFAVAFWVLEPIPIYATSVLIVTILLLIASDGGIRVLVAAPEGADHGSVLSYKALMHSFAEPIILLFLGGFFLAMAATKFQLDTNIARVLIRPFGTRPGLVMAGLMLTTAVFSMFMSNTATTAMMLAVLTPVLAGLPSDDRGRIGLVLAIPMAANIGGIGTPIGTPPNAVAMKYLTGEHAISFAGWMLFAVPYVAVLMLIAWGVLLLLFRPRTRHLTVDIQSAWRTDRPALLVYAVFAGTVLLWLTGPLHGIKSYVVAMLPVAIFSASGIINAQDLKRLSWDVLWLVAGGFALGTALQDSGLSQSVVAAIPFDAMTVPVLLGVAGLLTMLMATFMSNTATANLLLPILAAVAVAMPDLAGFGGAPSLILTCALAASMGMALPVSTPPNAMAHATGLISSRQMALAGGAIALIGLALVYGLIAVRIAWL